MTELPDEDWIKLSQFAETLADAAAQITVSAFRHVVPMENKLEGPGFDPVTKADRDAEAKIRHLIEDQFPAHGIDGEEYGQMRMEAEWRWILDPIDGTRAFISGLPTWGTLIALAYRGSPVIGIIDQPYLKERYLGNPQGAYLNGTPIKTRSLKALNKATLTTTDPDLFQDRNEKAGFQALKNKCQLIRYGLDCYGYAVMASGHMDLVLESGLNSYDMAALVPVIRGAGGVATDWNGIPVDQDGAVEGQILAAANADLHGEAVRILSEAQASVQSD